MAVRHRILVSTFLVLLASAAGAKNLLTYCLRDMVEEAAIIVVAEPLTTAVELPQTRWQNFVYFRVQTVLGGNETKKGDVLLIDTRMPALPASSEIEPGGFRPAELARCLLFLRHSQDGTTESPTFRLMSSGLRCQAKSGEILTPFQVSNPGGYRLRRGRLSSDPLSWEDIEAQVQSVQAQLRTLAEIGATSNLRDRNTLIFAWVDQQRTDLADETDLCQRWRKVLATIFGWIAEAESFEDSWKAARLWAKLDPRPYGERVDWRAFDSSQGRDWLVQIALDKNRSTEDRCFALRQLETSGTQRSLDVTETHQRIISLEPLHKDVEKPVRRQLLDTLASLRRRYFH